MKVVVLAGGKGTRLRPYTTVFPKPLMPVGEKPILEIIIDQLKSHGLKDIIITVGYLGDLLINFFGDGSKLDINVEYSKESYPLGTAGGLGLIKEKLKETFLMMNGDILTTLNYADLINYHKENGAVATVALKNRDVYIDFGVVGIDSTNSIKEYTEKPTLNYLVSMGIYVFEPRILKYINTGEKLDFPDLVKILIANGETVKGYVFNDYWLDIGRPDDYEKANEEMDQISGI